MATIPVSQLKSGEKIIENVQTKLGGVLFQKGKIVTERDIEVLKAFMVPNIMIESKTGEAEVSAEEQTQEEMFNTVLPFYQQYDKMFNLLKRVFTLAESNQSLPILEIRTHMEALIQNIDFYNVLTFTPRNNTVRDFLYHNSIMVALTSYMLAKWHGMPQKDLMPIALGGLLHDIGNAKIDDNLLYKPAKLTPAELEEVKKHTVIGYSILKSVPAINEGVKLCAVQHHEREDGSGYPLGVKGDKIHVYAKIVAVADMFHAMTNHRAHKKAASPYLVLEQLFTEAFGKMDPSMIQTFINKVTQFHNGTLVKLSDNRIGEIVFSDRSNPTRPWVNVNGTIVNLTLERNLFIKDVIQK
ncbi:HD-GYP domain-containing protein [Paenibacillus thalictri]|uniref:HD-GYP domain-containing protein n=1 Tax=Paenibacillus thalictri TaxID=2527873 RepID=A0A4Q9DPR9_9BACL|nr:HD-GYP domain-containing protein [Paenibacillus thalictri]TBL77477.1 HD-GYP domain-containing protein [Paenibacillus thalictri]